LTIFIFEIIVFNKKFIGLTKCLPLTWRFVQAGLDVETSAVCITALWFWLDGILLGF
jgi:hypothetical protein